jgi:single-strand DNA-binding protein
MTFITVGNLGRDPEMRYTPSGLAVSNFSMATNRVVGSGDKVKKEVTWIRFSAWGKQAETVNQYLHKGSKILVESSPVVDPETGTWRMWERNDGGVGASFEATVLSFKFMESKSETPVVPDQRPASVVDEEIPF